MESNIHCCTHIIFQNQNLFQGLVLAYLRDKVASYLNLDAGFFKVEYCLGLSSGFIYSAI